MEAGSLHNQTWHIYCLKVYSLFQSVAKTKKPHQIKKLEIRVKNSSGSPRILAGIQAMARTKSYEKMKVMESLCRLSYREML